MRLMILAICGVLFQGAGMCQGVESSRHPVADPLGAVGAWAGECAADGRIIELVRNTGKLVFKQGQDPQFTARQFILSHARHLRCASVELHLRYKRSGSNYDVLWFRQQVNDLPVFDGNVYLTIHRGQVVALRDNTVRTDQVFRTHPENGEEIRRELTRRYAEILHAELVETGYLNSTPAFRFRVTSTDGEPFQWIVSAETGLLLASRPMRHYNALTGSGYVFVPNPMSSTGNISLRDENDSAYEALNNARVEVPLMLLDGTGYLRNRYVDLTAPGISGTVGGYAPGSARETSGRFFYDRDDFRFEEVNAYYWITEFSTYISEMLDHPEAVDYAVPVNAHFMYADNSYYSEADRGLHFGDGVVDDAEDAEIILHEFGHAILHNLIPGLGSTWESAALDEGTCDYMAATFSQDAYFPDTIGEWDATGYDTTNDNPPRLRPIVTERIYPDNMYDPYPLSGSANFHWDGVIWSSTLWQIREHIGAVAADSVLFQSLPSFYPDISFGSAALRLINSELQVSGGTCGPTYRYFFTKRGILSNTYIQNPALPENPFILVFPLIRQDADFTSEITLLNPNAHAATARIQVVGDNGCLIYESVDRTLPPNGRATWQPVSGRLQETCWVLVEADQSLAGYVSMISRDESKSAFIPATKTLREILRVPHIAPQTEYWDTRTALVNGSAAPVEVRVDDYLELGGVLSGTNRPFGQDEFDWLTDYYAGQFPEGFAGQAQLVTSEPVLAGVETFQKKGEGRHQLAGLLLGHSASSEIWLPHIHTQGGYWWTGVVLQNQWDINVEITITARDDAGQILSRFSREMNAGEKWVALVQELWTSSGLSFPEETSSIHVSAPHPCLSGVELFGTLPESGDRLLAGINAATEPSQGLLFPHIIVEPETWAGIAFVNTGNGPASCTAEALNDAGEVLLTQAIPEDVPVNGRMVSTARDLFGGSVPEGTTQIRVSSNSYLVGFHLWGNLLPQQDYLSGMLAIPLSGSQLY